MDDNLFGQSEAEGIREIKLLNEEYLQRGDGSRAVRNFLEKVGDDDAFLLRFLKGRKYRSKHAWESIKRYAEVRYETYPELFPAHFPSAARALLDEFIIIVLKARDCKGRRIVCFNASDWDPEVYSIDLITIASVQIVEKLVLDEDCINNGLVAIQECSGMAMKHAKQYSLRNMLRMLNVFWYAFPLKLKGVYYMNVPYFLSFLYGIIRPFFPKKLRDRFILTSTDKKFEKLHERISPDVLPKSLGGKLENIDACDLEFINI